MVNWKKLFRSRDLGKMLVGFSNGSVSGRQLTSAVTNTSNAGDVRTLLRRSGVKAARTATKRAMKRVSS
jgi:hypothetical protein